MSEVKSDAQWCNVVSYHDGSSILDVYGPYADEAGAKSWADTLQNVGVHPYDRWEQYPMWQVVLNRGHAL